jgi:hypothetical protein
MCKIQDSNDLVQWYTKEELAKRNAIFYSGSLISGAFGNLIAAGILNGLDGSMGISAWQWYSSRIPHCQTYISH